MPRYPYIYLCYVRRCFKTRRIAFAVRSKKQREIDPSIHRELLVHRRRALRSRNQPIPPESGHVVVGGIQERREAEASQGAQGRQEGLRRDRSGKHEEEERGGEGPEGAEGQGGAEGRTWRRRSQEKWQKMSPG
ncbi:Os02g0159300 [Oryza sativa Japonica Group]|nr:hypothetical protein EE612_008994 [Oryza sativa]BAS77090.1 Os02g0159300 [Oryza sativa Japonica Group]